MIKKKNHEQMLSSIITTWKMSWQTASLRFHLCKTQSISYFVNFWDACTKKNAQWFLEPLLMFLKSIS